MKQELTGEMEKRIIQAATKAFISKGNSGTSMQDIANEAGINRTLLNYYFRTKEKLFDLVFENVISSFLPEFLKIMSSEKPILEKFRSIIDVYFNMLEENPLVPNFILHEISVDPELMVKNLRQKGLDPKTITGLIQAEMDAGNLKKTDPRNLMVNLLGLIIFPFVARPLINGLLFPDDNSGSDKFFIYRREYLKEYFIESIKS